MTEKKLSVFITARAYIGNCAVENLCRTSLHLNFACKVDTSILKTKRTQIQLTLGSLEEPVLINRINLRDR